jgi:hypothetical protein
MNQRAGRLKVIQTLLLGSRLSSGGDGLAREGTDGKCRRRTRRRLSSNSLPRQIWPTHELAPLLCEFRPMLGHADIRLACIYREPQSKRHLPLQSIFRLVRIVLPGGRAVSTFVLGEAFHCSCDCLEEIWNILRGGGAQEGFELGKAPASAAQARCHRRLHRRPHCMPRSLPHLC